MVAYKQSYDSGQIQILPEVKKNLNMGKDLLTIICFLGCFISLVEAKYLKSSTENTIEFLGKAKTHPANEPCKYKLSLLGRHMKVELSCDREEGYWEISATMESERMIENVELYEKGYEWLEVSSIYELVVAEEEKGIQVLFGTVSWIVIFVDTKLNWEYEILLSVGQGQTILLKGEASQFSNYIVYIMVIYTVLAVLTFSLKIQLPTVTLFTSLHLSSNLLLIVATAIIEYLIPLNENSTPQLIIMELLLVISFAWIIVEIVFKMKSWWKKCAQQKKWATLCFGFLYYFFGISVFVSMDKNWFTYGYFLIGLVYYLLQSILPKIFKESSFSFWPILHDCVAMSALALANRYYPCLNYQIPSYYTLFIIFIISFMLLIITGLIKIFEILQEDANPPKVMLTQIKTTQSNETNKCFKSGYHNLNEEKITHVTEPSDQKQFTQKPLETLSDFVKK